MIINTESAKHYKWGGPQGTDCDGWHLVKTPELSVIEELMPPNPTAPPAQQPLIGS